MSRHHNGNQEAVLAAVRAGHDSIAAIMAATGASYYGVHNALRRLRDLNLVSRTDGRGRNVHVPITLEHQADALTQAWRNVSHGTGGLIR